MIETKCLFIDLQDALVPLDRVKDTKALREMVLVKHGRLSVQPVKKSEFAAIVKMAKAGGRGI